MYVVNEVQDQVVILEQSQIVFFFQAEDGIRGWSVTGVQTCALPIWNSSPLSLSGWAWGTGLMCG